MNPGNNRPGEWRKRIQRVGWSESVRARDANTFDDDNGMVRVKRGGRCTYSLFPQ